MFDVADTSSACPCGAEQPYRECCGRLAAGERGPREEPAQVYPLYGDAQRAAAEQRFVHTLAAAREILRLVPLHYGAMRLALAVPEPLRVFDAEALAEIASRGRAAYPEDAEFECDAAGAYLAAGQVERAEQSLRAVLEAAPHHVRAHVGLGHLARRRHQLDVAEYHYRQAYYQQRFAPGVLAELGGVLSALGRKSEAEHYFRIALAQAPDHGAALMAWCRMEESRGNLDRAGQLLDRATTSPDDAGATIMRAVLQRRRGQHKQALVSLDAVDTERLDAPGRVALDLERCTTLDTMGLHAQAFEAAARANAVKRDQLGFVYDGDRHAGDAARLKKTFTAARFRTLTRGAPASDNEEQPIFICGFTRSGTSLVEQILSAHSGICGGDELPFIFDLAANATGILGSELPFPDCLFETPPAGQAAPLQVLRQRYLARLRLTSILEPGVRRFTDKMPMNELHLGLIHGLFPEAKIIHVVRHPLDAVLSTFFTDATHGGHCSYDLAAAARHYRLALDMAEHYRGKLGIPLLRVRYEDIVADIHGQTGRMLDFIGVDFEEQCLEFHRNPRYARTASYAQVTRRLYDSSVYRHRHYREPLQPVAAGLKAAIRRLRYPA